jgi:UDP-glucose 4-epimerase
MSKILITGGSGFVGSSLVNEYMRSNKEVIVFDNLSTGRIENISQWSHKPHFKFMQADLLDRLSLKKAVDKCNIVFHLAANPIVALGATNTKIDYEQNLLATYNLLELMRESNKCKKIVFASTSAVYGEPEVMPTSEKYSPLKPISLYGATKLACEAIISGYCYMFNMSATIFRLANIIGPTSTHGVIYDFFTKLSANSKYLKILGNGKQNKSYLYIDDCIEALKLGAEMEERFEIFNVGSNDRINVLDIAKIVITELSMNNVSLKFTDGFDGRGWKGDVKEYLLDSSKLRNLGWKARHNSREAVVLTAHELVSRVRGPLKKNRSRKMV